MKRLLQERQIESAIISLANQLLENYASKKKLTLIGIQSRGVFFSNRIMKYLKTQKHGLIIEYGKLDITFYRDDLKNYNQQPNKTDILFPLDNKEIVLIDDVLYTGRTIRAAMDALMDFGRPKKIELMVMINRIDTRELPIQPDYLVKNVESSPQKKVLVHWKEQHGIDEIVII